ncbi:multiheme c-type cytochrome [Anaeromyxobacter oryzae]|uniref:multiheme c-type cytochrome n=1 Tax=Anaeromyxobacter oryzae TaxID=2918170 RepID=UPI0020BE58BF|nr:hypothetical protein [Anaeromyxobacter oryzae]
MTAAGCSGGAKSSGTGSDPGVSEGTFTVVVQNGQSINGAAANPGLAIKGGYVTSNPAGIDCGAGGHALCSATFAYDAKVTLTATVTDPTYRFWGWAGDCSGDAACDVTGKADKYLVAQFDTVSGSTGHPNYASPAEHAPAYYKHDMDCRACHGAALQGAGLAVACDSCHKPVLAGTTTQPVEQCNTCHAGEGKSLHQNIYNTYVDATKLTATIDSVTSAPNATAGFDVTVLFTLKKSGVALTAADYAALGQKRLSLTRYTGTSGFETATAATLKAATFVANGQFKSVTTGVKFDPKSATENGFFYFYFADKSVVPPGGHYFLPDNTVSVAQQFGTIPWTSTANVSACEACHGKEYAKHGYRQAKVAGLSDFVACKACHTDQRGGVDFNLAMAYEDPARLAALEAQGAVCGGELCWSPADEETYAYTANTMSDTHISHAKEFLYPQSMGNCATCHAGKLDRILTDANFTGNTCKTCHLYVGVNGEDPKRAPKLAPAYHNIDWVKGVLLESDGATPPTITEMQCNECHNATWVAPWDGVTKAPLFSDLHTGYDAKIYTASGARWADIFKAAITSATFDSTTKALTINFTITGTTTDGYSISNIDPQLMIGPYAFDTKDWAQSYFSLDLGGATKTGVTLVTNGQSTGTWSITVDLDAASTAWATQLGNGDIRRVEIGIRPWMTSTTTWAVLPAAAPSPALTGPEMALDSVTRTFDLAANAFADSFYAPIVSVAKCNKCHDALATTFHEAASEKNRGGSVVACRLCHTVRSGGGHLEMQSRSIDSYVHSIHSFQAFDIQNVDFANTVQAFEYEAHIGSTYPNFTTLSCESCHNPGTYEAQPESKSLPGIQSASKDVLKGETRAISGIPSVVTGAGSRACGGCHRAKFINKDDAAGLNAFDQHTADFGYRLVPVAPATTTTVLDKTTADLKTGGVLK